ncbi:MAG: YjbH domain-containing protein, partial [SAR86 cluster bacterium]|nr:YjbH domain-containing protein [SAR86 cluster bacterium]
MKSSLRAFSFYLFLLFNTHLSASLEDYYPYQLTPTSSNYGYTGLLEMPSARFMDGGALKFGISASYPNEYTFIVASPFSWFEAGYRYAEV